MARETSERGDRRAHGPWLLGSVVTLAVLLTVILGWRLHGRARDTACLANLRELGIAVELYAADHGDLLPPARYGAGERVARWPDLVRPYADSLGVGWRCPRDGRAGSAEALSYGLNARLAGARAGAQAGARPLPLHASDDVADVALLADTDGPRSYLIWGSWASADEGRAYGSWLAPRHKRAVPSGPQALAAPPRSWGVNVCYVDGHAQWVWSEKLETAATW